MAGPILYETVESVPSYEGEPDLERELRSHLQLLEDCSNSTAHYAAALLEWRCDRQPERFRKNANTWRGSSALIIT